MWQPMDIGARVQLVEDISVHGESVIALRQLLVCNKARFCLVQFIVRSLQQLAELESLQQLAAACRACRALRGRSLPGVAGQGFALRVCLRLRVRLACVRVRAAWSSWCVRVCLRACARVRAAARVRSRCSSRQLHFLRRAFGRRVAGEFVVEVRGGSEAEESVH